MPEPNKSGIPDYMYNVPAADYMYNVILTSSCYNEAVICIMKFNM